ncbi:unnamed protein product [Schistosoma mattheei]|uniref:Uncharacterized protein n=1 Tax=Schistosoma mattheei TaxID=31246 RepID=A0A183NQG4_9TREM|nr:unnamed protein product [Schistosoma mattheei]
MKTYCILLSSFMNRDFRYGGMSSHMILHFSHRHSRFIKFTHFR